MGVLLISSVRVGRVITMLIEKHYLEMIQTKKKVNHSKKLEVQTEGKRKHQCQVRVVVLLSACLTAANSFCTVSEIHLHT